jgi:hypothetical protein
VYCCPSYCTVSECDVEVVWLRSLGAAKRIDFQRARHVGKPPCNVFNIDLQSRRPCPLLASIQLTRITNVEVESGTKPSNA